MAFSHLRSTLFNRCEKKLNPGRHFSGSCFLRLAVFEDTCVIAEFRFPIVHYDDFSLCIYFSDFTFDQSSN